MNYLRKLFILFALTGFFCSALLAADNSIRQGKKAVEQSNWQQAAKIFWQAAQKGNLEAINYLSAIYIVSGQDFSREIFDTNIPAVAEKLFPCQTASEPYAERFVIITSENAINKKVLQSIKNCIKKQKVLLQSAKWSAIASGALNISGGGIGWSIAGLWKGDEISKKYILSTITKKSEQTNYLFENIADYKKTLAIDTEKGKIYARAKDIKGLGKIAVVDRETAKKYFTFSIHPDKDWSVYVRCPGDEDYLIPFADFHKFVYEKKMRSFVDLCRYLGATNASVSYAEKKTTEFDQKYRIEGAHKSGIKSGANANINTLSTQSDLAKYDFKWSGSSTVSRVEGYWLSTEPSWKAMYDSRLDLANPLKECIVDFNYTEDYSVNVETKVYFENAEMNISLGTNHHFNEMQEKSWHFKVLFPVATEISTETKILK